MQNYMISLNIQKLLALMRKILSLCCVIVLVVASGAVAQAGEFPVKFKWIVSEPLVAPVQREDFCYSVKDPSIVFYNGRWHLFCTIRSQKRTHQIEYLSFTRWDEANKAERHILKVSDGYFCAPQVFYFTPHKKWYMIYQVNEPTRKPSLQPAWSVNDNISDPYLWSKPVLLFSEHPENVTGWIDFWVICDDKKAHLFFTSNDGRMWRAETALDKFPAGWSKPQVVLKADIFEASHTYKIKGRNLYLTVVEAQRGGRRYYKAYIADKLDGEWKPLADTYENAFASPANTRDKSYHWTDSFSHGELIRAGYDEKLEVDLSDLQFLFQGVSDKEREGKKYGEIPWRLGLLTLDKETK